SPDFCVNVLSSGSPGLETSFNSTVPSRREVTFAPWRKSAASDCRASGMDIPAFRPRIESSLACALLHDPPSNRQAAKSNLDDCTFRSPVSEHPFRPCHCGGNLRGLTSKRPPWQEKMAVAGRAAVRPLALHRAARHPLRSASSPGRVPSEVLEL